MARRRAKSTISSDPHGRLILVAQNRRARYEYELGEEFMAGLVLTGTEIKSIRERNVSIVNAYVQADPREAWIHGMYIARYQPAAGRNHDPDRPRKLLLSRKELLRISARTQQQGFTAVPLALLIQGRFAKLRFSVARGRKSWDKRRKIDSYEAEARIRRLLKTAL